MAIDTATRRAAAISFGRVNLLPLPVPDGTVDAGDRAHLLRLYSALVFNTYNEAVTEAMTFADVPSVTATFPMVVTEDITFADVTSSLGTLGSAVVETLTFADAPSSVGSFHHSVTEAFTLSDAGKAVMDNTVRMGYVCRPPQTWGQVQGWLRKLNEILRRIDERLGDLE